MFFVNVFLKSGNSFSLSFSEESQALDVMDTLDVETSDVYIYREDGRLRAKFNIGDLEAHLLTFADADDDEEESAEEKEFTDMNKRFMEIQLKLAEEQLKEVKKPWEMDGEF